MNEEETGKVAKQIEEYVERSFEEVLKSLPKVNGKAVILATTNITLSFLITIYHNWEYDARGVLYSTCYHEFEKYINHEEDRFDD